MAREIEAQLLALFPSFQEIEWRLDVGPEQPSLPWNCGFKVNEVVNEKDVNSELNTFPVSKFC